MKKVIVIDDDKLFIDLIIQLLPDISIDSAQSEKSAFMLLSHNRYDLIILDYMIPGTYGIDILKGLKAKDITTPVLMISSKAQAFDIDMAYMHGVKEYLVKPIDRKELVKTVHKFLS